VTAIQQHKHSSHMVFFILTQKNLFYKGFSL
jgi:hypothetical protein